MKIYSILLCGVMCLSTVSLLQAGDFILYGGMQKPGKIEFSSATEIPDNLLDGDYGGTFGIRVSGGRIVGFEENISFSPRFAFPGVYAFQMDSNLLLQAPGRVVPYATAGIGFIYTWGQDYPEDLDPLKVAAYAFSFGQAFSVNYGGGLKLRRLAGPLGFNIDVRGYTVPGARDGTLHFLQTSAGIVITW